MKPARTKERPVDGECGISAAPDRFERIVRFVCGALLGIVAGVGIAVQTAELGVVVAIGSIVGSTIACGLLAMRYGDRFWYGLRHWF